MNRRAATGVVWSGGAQIITQLVTLGARIIQARLLSPGDFGLLGMATVVLSFIELLAGLGLGAAVVQAPELDETDRSTAFWTAIVQGLVLAVLGVAAAPLVAELFNEPRLVPVLQVLLAGSALLGPLAVVQGFFWRSLDFKTVATRQVTGDILGNALGIALAFGGAGVWSLVAGRLADSAIGLALVWWKARWRPTWTVSLASLRKLGAYSAGTTAGGVFQAATRQLPAIIIGRALGSEALGLFALTQQIVLMPLQYVARPISRVLFPTFARLQDRPAELARSYLKWQTAIVALGSLILASIAAVAPVAVPRFLGEKWAPAVPLFALLAIPALGRLSLAVAGSSLRALGRLRLLGIWTMVGFVAQGIGLLVGLRGGLFGAVAGWACGCLVSLLAGLVTSGYAMRIPMMRQLRPLRVVALPALTLVGVAWGVLRGAERWGWGGNPAIILLALALSSLAYVACLYLTAREDWDWLVGAGRSYLPQRWRQKLEA